MWEDLWDESALSKPRNLGDQNGMSLFCRRWLQKVIRKITGTNTDCVAELAIS